VIKISGAVRGMTSPALRAALSVAERAPVDGRASSNQDNGTSAHCIFHVIILLSYPQLQGAEASSSTNEKIPSKQLPPLQKGARGISPFLN